MSAATEAGGRVGVSPGSRAWGFGSIFGKALRDSRWALLGAALFVGFVVLAVAATLGLSFPEAADRARLVSQMQALPAMFRGLLGEPIAIDRLPGFISWRALNFMPLLVGIWSILALSGALAGEVGRGSMEMLAAVPASRWSIALQKVAAHVVALFAAMSVAAVITWLATLAFAALPGDEASLAASLAEYAWSGAGALFGGAMAFMLGPIVGRAAAAGSAASVLIGSYVINGFAEAVTFFEQIRFLSLFRWTAGHRPLAGVDDWAPILAVGALDALLIGVGVVAFMRRDIGGLVGAGLSPFAARWSVLGPAGRSLAERLPAALAFGLGIGVFGFYIAVSAESFAQVMAEVPELDRILRTFFPDVDLFSAAGILELMFAELAILLLGLAAAVLAHGWASDERDRRLEMVLAAPIERLRWALSSGWGVLLAALVLTVAVAAPTFVAVLATGDDVVPPMVGVLVLGLYVGALVGFGLAVGGLVSPTLAGAVVGLYVVTAFVLELVGGALDLPGWLLDLSLARHLGQPFIGRLDLLGAAVCVALAAGGLALGAWGLVRRDLRA
jgi:ABC-2 type transport system permease protein